MAQSLRTVGLQVTKPVAKQSSVAKTAPASSIQSAKSSFVGQTFCPTSSNTVVRGSRTSLNVFAREAQWAPGSEAPDWLTGSLPGDFGFDPLGLGKNPETLAYYRQAELVHARFAMLGVAGILFPDIAAKAGLSWPGAGVPWYEAGDFKYFAPSTSLFVVQLLLMGWAEIRRSQDIKNPGSVAKDPVFGASLPEGEVGYPGGIFDPFGYSKGNMAELQLKEIKNGRLAMMAMLGFYVQHAVVGGTPVDNWLAHISDPWNTSILSNCSSFFVWDFAAPSEVITKFAPVA